MLGTWLEAAYQDSKNNNKRVLYLKEEKKLLKATELILSMKMEQLQNQLKGENVKKSWRKTSDLCLCRLSILLTLYRLRN